MKTILLSVVALLFAVFSFGQTALPAYPSKSAESVTKFLEELNAISDNLAVEIDKCNKANDAIGEKIDPSKMTAAYGMGQDVNALMERQKRTMANVELYNRIQALGDKYSKMKKEILDRYEQDYAPFNEARINLINHCIGEVGSNNNCDQLVADKNSKGDVILTKYYFGNGAELVGWLNAFISEVPPLSKQYMIEAMSLQEENIGVQFPHKADLATMMEQKAIVDAMIDVFGLDMKLFNEIF